jgi:hypothetical protein
MFDNKVLRKISKGKVVFSNFGAGSMWQWTVFLMLQRNLKLPFSVQMIKPFGEKTLLCREEQNRTGIMSEQRGSGGLETPFEATSGAVFY